MINSKYCCQDNARLHVSLMTRQKWLQLAWEIWRHLPYAPDTAPLGFPFTLIIKFSSWKKNFNSLEDYKRHLEQFFAQKK